MNTDIKVRYHNPIEIEANDIAFGLLDRKGRIIGYRWSIAAVEVRPVTADDAKNGYYSYYLTSPAMVALGTLYRLDCSVTRAGKDYGAGQSFIYFPTADAARADVTKKAAAARKRYAAKPQEAR